MTYRMIPGMLQIETAPEVFLHMFYTWRPDRIVEIGCGSGRWTMCLAALVGPAARIYAFDTRLANRPVVRSVTWKVASCWDIQDEIEALIRLPGSTLLLCDGGNKVKEFNTFASSLKPGDVIAAHDYSPNKQEFVDIIRRLVWKHNEITDDQISEAICNNNLQPFMHDLMQEALWGCWRRQ